MDKIQKQLEQLDDEHMAFRKLANELEWDYHDMKFAAKKQAEDLRDWVASFYRRSPIPNTSYELEQLEENKEAFMRQIRRYEDRLEEAYHEENRLYNKKLEELEKAKKNFS